MFAAYLIIGVIVIGAFVLWMWSYIIRGSKSEGCLGIQKPPKLGAHAVVKKPKKGR
jgi:hypothetical protein